MIVVRLMGGLGNQLFQYAAGRHLAHLNNTELFLDTTLLEQPDSDKIPRVYELGVFNVQCSIADEQIVKQFHGSEFSAVDRAITKMISLGKNKKYRFEGFGFDEHVLELKGNYYLCGFFMSEKYFKPIEDVIRKELTVKPEFIPADHQLTQKIKESKSVAVHIRRGDYIRNLSSMEAHGLCSKDYYAKSIDYIKTQLGTDAHYFIFTDDEAWIKKEMDWDINYTLISDKSAVEDFYWMSLCRHTIIANSTFSWWAAWLNANPEKIVVMPKHWTNNIKSEDIKLNPKNWILK
jgi:hypothetical protein